MRNAGLTELCLAHNRHRHRILLISAQCSFDHREPKSYDSAGANGIEASDVPGDHLLARARGHSDTGGG